MQDEKIENEAMKSAKETLKKKTKNKVTKIIWNAVKAVVIPMLIFALKIMAVAILIIIAISLFNNVLDGNNGSTSTDEEYSSYIEDSISGGADITADQWLFTETQVEDFIINYNSENVSLKNQMLNNIRRIQEWQAHYGYSAGLLITMAFEENVSDFDEFLEDMNYIAQSWKDNEYTTINQIAQDYVGDETTSEWANNITNKLQNIAIDSGIIQTGQEIDITGDGYFNGYVSTSGKMYRNYKQNMGLYKDIVWYPNGLTVEGNGCALISTTIILSGYTNGEINPLQIAAQYASYDGMSVDSALDGFGINYDRVGYSDNELSSQDKARIKQHVGQGYSAIIRVVSPSPFTDSQHFMAILDYNPATNEFYVSNPYSGPGTYGRTGWIDADYVLYKCARCYYIY